MAAMGAKMSEETWDEFRSSVASRFLVPVHQYHFRLDYVTFQPDRDTKSLVAQVVLDAIVETLKNTGGSLQHLKFYDGDDRSVLFTIAYTVGPYDMVLQVKDSCITIKKSHCPLDTLRKAHYEFFLPLAEQLFHDSSRYSLTQFVFFKNIYSATHTFATDLLLGSRLSNDKIEVSNTEVMDTHAIASGGNSIQGLLQPDKVLRTDVEMSILKVVAGRPANLWITLKAPLGEGMREVRTEFMLRRGDTVGKLEHEDMLEFGGVISYFYRDIVLERIYTNIFNDINITLNPAGRDS